MRERLEKRAEYPSRVHVRAMTSSFLQAILRLEIFRQRENKLWELPGVESDQSLI